MSRETVLSLLLAHPGEYLSGAAMSRTLGVSRAAVWKAIEALRQEGYEITSAPNRGYRLESAPDRVREGELSGHLAGCLVGSRLLCLDTIDSTNTEAKRLLNAGYRGNFLVVADEQTAGRGRQGKQFYSPRGTGIYMTVVVHHGRRLQDAVSVTTAAGVAVCRAIEELTDKHPQIKWVNDVYIDDKKICGILTEAVVGMESGLAEAMIIGIGANMQTEEFPPEVENAASLDADVSRADMIAAIADHLWEILDDGYESYIDYYRSHSMLLGKAITFIRDGVTTPATAIGIDEIGGLVVRLEDDSVITLRSGEITVRPRCTKKS